MSPAKFDAVVQRVSELARQRPRAYRRRLIGMAYLGYAYIAAVILGLLALGVATPLLLHGHAGAAVVKLEIVILSFAFVIVRAMWVAIRPEEGSELTREDVPALFAAVERVRLRMDAPKVRKILITPDLNAAVQQVPRFGVFGSRNYLILGLPLLQTLSPAQFDAVLAHEFGHLSRRHGRLGAWIYRIRIGWNRLVESMERGETWLRYLFGPFFRWYAPLFSAYSFVQARAQEYEADRSAAEAFGARHSADALVRVRLAGGFLGETYWPSILSQVERSAEPPANAFSAIAPALSAQFASPAADDALAKALTDQTTSADTHPCLRERLAALGEDPMRPAAAAETAAHLLGEHAAALARHFDEDWHRSVTPQWKLRHDSVVRERATLEALQQKAPDERTADDWWELCRLTHALDRADAALPLCREMSERFPDHKPARYALGALLLARDDADGLAHLEAGMKDNPSATVDGWNLVYGFLRRHGREDEAEAFYARAVAAEDTLHANYRERATIDRRTRYLPADAADAVRAQLIAIVAGDPEIKRAYLVRKQLTRTPENPLHVLAVLRRSRWYRWESGKENQQLVDRLVAALGDVSIPVQCYVVHQASLLRRIRRIPASQIHPLPRRRA